MGGGYLNQMRLAANCAIKTGHLRARGGVRHPQDHEFPRRNHGPTRVTQLRHVPPPRSRQGGHTPGHRAVPYQRRQRPLRDAGCRNAPGQPCPRDYEKDLWHSGSPRRSERPAAPRRARDHAPEGRNTIRVDLRGEPRAIGRGADRSAVHGWGEGTVCSREALVPATRPARTPKEARPPGGRSDRAGIGDGISVDVRLQFDRTTLPRPTGSGARGRAAWREPPMKDDATVLCLDWHGPALIGAGRTPPPGPTTGASQDTHRQPPTTSRSPARRRRMASATHRTTGSPDAPGLRAGL